MFISSRLKKIILELTFTLDFAVLRFRWCPLFLCLDSSHGVGGLQPLGHIQRDAERSSLHFLPQPNGSRSAAQGILGRGSPHRCQVQVRASGCVTEQWWYLLTLEIKACRCLWQEVPAVRGRRHRRLAERGGAEERTCGVGGVGSGYTGGNMSLFTC